MKIVVPMIATVVFAASSHADEPVGFPKFSWDTIPVYLHFGKRTVLTEEELKFVAETSNFVCLEKGHGSEDFGSTEKGIAHDAKRLKMLSPDIKVLFYWNTFLNYERYDCRDEVATHPQWLFRDAGGKPIYKVRNLEQYNLLDPDFRRWWASIASKAVKEYGCDGIFMDAVNQAKRPTWMRRGWGLGSESKLTDAVTEMMQLASEAMGDEAILLFNGIRSNDAGEETTGLEYIEVADGATVEHFTGFASRGKESIARDIDAIGRAGKSGKLVVVKGWPDPEFTWLNERKMRTPYAQLAKEAIDKMAFSLACYLVAAEANCYFCYSWGYRENHGSLVDYPQFHKPLGAPHGDALRTGWTYQRSFEHAEVTVDLATRQANIQWKKQ